MSRSAARSMVIAAGLVSITWPIAVAYFFLRHAFTRPYVVHETAILAIPASIVCVAIATAISVRHPPTEATDWMFRCAVAGGVIAELWLALGIYVNDRRTVDEMLGMVLRGILIAAPVGFIVGLAVGAEMAAIDQWVRRFQTEASRVPVFTVIVNAVAAVVLWLL